MYPEIYSVACDFGIFPRSIVRCKYFYIIHTDKTAYSICKARVNINRLMEIYQLKEQLWALGFRAMDRFLRGKNDLPYVEKEGEVYTMTQFKGANELDFLNNIQYVRALEAIGSMEGAMSRVESSSVVKAASFTKPQPLEEMEKGIKSLKKCRKDIYNQKTLRDWDMTVLKVYDKYYERAVNSLQKLENSNIFNGYIHNRLKEGNILYNYGKICIIDWDYMTVGSPLWDLAFFINRYKRKNAYYAHLKGFNYLNLEDMLCAYEKYNPLSDSEKQDLCAMLDYPRQFVAVTSEIYRKSRRFIPAGLKMKLNETVEQVDFQV